LRLQLPKRTIDKFSRDQTKPFTINPFAISRCCTIDNRSKMIIDKNDIFTVFKIASFGKPVLIDDFNIDLLLMNKIALRKS
jgi:hypothetical protein